MKLENINVTETIEKARGMLKDTKNVPAELAPVFAMFSVLLTILEILEIPSFLKILEILENSGKFSKF